MYSKIILCKTKEKNNESYFRGLMAKNIEIYNKIKKYIENYPVEVKILLLETAIKAKDQGIDDYYLFRYYIEPLLEANPRLAKIKDFEKLIDLFLEVAIKAKEQGIKKAKEQGINDYYFLEYGISPLLVANPSLAERENIKDLENFINLFLNVAEEAKEKGFDKDYLFPYCINPLLEANPHLANIENINELKEFINLFLNVAKEAKDQGIYDYFLFRYYIKQLLKANPHLAKIENIKDLEEFTNLLLEVAIKVNNIHYIIEPLLEANPPLAKIENIKDLEGFINLFLEVVIKAKEQGVKVKYFLKKAIPPLLKVNTRLANIENINELKEFINLLLEVAIKAKEKGIKYNYFLKYAIPPLLKANTRLANIENINDLKEFINLFLNLTIKAEEKGIDNGNFLTYSIEPLLEANPSLAYVENIDTLKEYITRFEKIIDKIPLKETFNRIIKEIKINDLNKADYLGYLDFVISIIDKHKRVALSIIQSINEGLRENVFTLDKLLGEERSLVFAYIDEMNSFNPELYQIYKNASETERVAILKELGDIASELLSDKQGLDYYQTIIDKYNEQGLDGLAILASIIQIKMPFSGASFIKKEEVIALLKKHLEIGDKRDDIPEDLRNFRETASFEQVEYVLKEGEAIDKEGKLARILESLRGSDYDAQGNLAKDKTEERKKELKQAIAAYLGLAGGEQKEASEIDRAFQNIRQAFYKYASCFDQLQEKVGRIVELDFSGLKLLDHLFRDKDNLPTLLKDVLKEMDDQLFIVRTKESIGEKADGLKRAINKIFKNDQTRDDKLVSISKLLSKYEKESISNFLEKIDDLTAEEKAEIVNLSSGEQKGLLSKDSLLKKIFKAPQNLIAKELDKFEQVVKKETLDMEFKPVKGIAYGLWGINAGVCIGDDTELWQKPNFFLIAMTDKKNGQVLGFIHCFTYEKNGKKYLFIPGIEPSEEAECFLDQSLLLDQIDLMLKDFGKDFDYIGIASKRNEEAEAITSNRTGMKKAIKQKYSPVQDLGFTVDWSTSPDYHFSQVYWIRQE